MKKIILVTLCFITSIASAETVRVVYKPDKSVIVVIPSQGGDYETKALDCMKSSGLEGLPYEDMDSSLLPQTREKRNYWEGEKTKPITINEVKYQADQLAKPKTLEQKVSELETKVSALEVKP